MDMIKQGDAWRLLDGLPKQMVSLSPLGKSSPYSRPNPRVANQPVMNANFIVFRNAFHWNALTAIGICSSTSAYR